MKPGHWTSDDHETLARLWESGSNDAEIAAVLKRTERSICNKRHDLGMCRYRRDTRRADGGDSLAEQLKIARDALDECELIAKIERLDDLLDTCTRARKRIEKASR